MSGFGAGVRRGVMAADQFTQIANGLFRDSRISYRAKGIFGYISTHRNGWLVTIAALVALGPDGRDAVRAGLNELEKCGYLVRDRVRRPNGTLGEIVYSITDRPAAPDVPLIAPASAPAFLEPGSDAGFGAGIRRGVMAGDQFTQIANELFRDTRISFKAKGLFGYISTHRDGWQVTIANLARHGRERVDAVTTGLEELGKHGFLLRDRARNTDGTLGQALYFITDLPALQNPSSQPESGYPGLAEPVLADPGTKNTIVKKTNKQKANPLRPCDRGDAVHTNGRTDPLDATASPAPTPPADEMHPGIRLLLEIGASRPELLLTGKPLTDQGRVATVMMDAGWSAEQLRHVITDRPLPHPVRTSVGAIIAARLRAAQAYPLPATAADHHDAPPWDEPYASATTERSSMGAAARTVTEALTYRALVECAGCGVPATAPGEDLCPACLGWPLCRTCPGPTPRRAHPDGDGRCRTCASV
ncbi:hypothetical protein FNV65_05985 [Streptomyces sp. S1A1-8]|uniref:hypothetical protein n=1 Tax=unclassified Streptomyces TaxID=2593676 RepID=UPI001164A65D|nr:MULTISPECIES: hypothetical protein [unclassified Streptomyces]QDN95919.1 hypothetical protein FNV58_07415 [Streptomyces sp. RLB1-9]QDO17642.1 hypothetical protein FNV65_05985 [Streptomyces sp. S1A1-8]QDO27765.1 hypothetical protein FNV63_05975 [Streptomyces sp. S1A1-3]